MYSEQFDLSAMSFGDGLALLEITVDDILALKTLKGRQKQSREIIDKIPVKEAFDVFTMNASRNYFPTKLAKSSIETYGFILKQFHEYCSMVSHGEMEVTEIPAHAVDFIIWVDDKKRFKTSTWNKYVAVLRTFLYFVADYYTAGYKKLPDFRREDTLFPQALSATEVSQLLKMARQAQYGIRTHFLMIFILSTGLRRNEFRLAQLRDIDFEGRTLLVRHGKGDQTRMVALPEPLLPIIKEYLQIYGIHKPTDYLYGQLQRPQFPVSPQAIDQVALRVFQKMPTYQKNDVRFGYHLHSLRHTYAVFLLNAGVPLRAIADCLGHRSLLSTQRYTVLDSEGLRRVIQPGLDYFRNLLEG